jgi:AraC-like DNA-binding protein
VSSISDRQTLHVHTLPYSHDCPKTFLLAQSCAITRTLFAYRASWSYLTRMALHVPRSVPDDARFDDLPIPEPAYGGHPSPLAGVDAQNRAMALLKSGRSCTEVARLFGYQGPAAFSDAFKRFCGVRPSAYAKSVDAPKPKPKEGQRRLQKRKPRHVGAKPLPRFDAKKKGSKKRTSKK